MCTSIVEQIALLKTVPLMAYIYAIDTQRVNREFLLCKKHVFYLVCNNINFNKAVQDIFDSKVEELQEMYKGPEGTVLIKNMCKAFDVKYTNKGLAIRDLAKLACKIT